MSNETWRGVIGWEDQYEVSDQGRVRRAPKILATFLNKDGLPSINLQNEDGEKLKKRVHHLVLETFKGDCPNAFRRCRRLNGNKLDNRAENLEWSDGPEEREYVSASGKLAAVAEEIRAKKSTGASSKALAREYKVSPKAIRDIAQGKTYRKVDDGSDLI